MYGNSTYEKKHLAKIFVVVVFGICTRHFMKMRHELIDEIKTNRAYENTQNRNENSNLSLSVFKRGNDKTDNRRRKHNARGKRKNYIGKGVRELLEYKAYRRAENGRAANSERSQ
jgi:hypothetical protein